MSRFRFVLAMGTLTLAGCGDAFNAGAVKYVASKPLADDLREKPQLQQAISLALVDLFGESPRSLVVPPGSGFPGGGVRLANRLMVDGQPKAILVKDAATQQNRRQEGGYALYRKHCLHCHGVSGDGNGPTADFLFPKPRDFRKGLYKFTSTNTGIKPTRADLRKTLLHGLHGTSMPSFEALMSTEEVEQVLDYVIFLSMRGETELALVDEASSGALDEAVEQDVKSNVAQIPAAERRTKSAVYPLALEIAQSVFNKWTMADGQVANPPAPRPASTSVSIARGKALFLGLNKSGNQVNCYACHGNTGKGDGSNFVEKSIFDRVVFYGESIEDAIRRRYDELKGYEEGAAAHAAEHPAEGGTHAAEAPRPKLEDFEVFQQRMMTTWKGGTLDDWGNPFRPANLNLGIYKGGRRPIDLYWRIAKGINGAKMPAHFPTLQPEQIWDLVNFVLALPYEPKLLADADELRKDAPVVTNLPVAGR